ncbi:hypothetical protein GCM10027051_20500 [Niabella terrae]
MAFNENSRVKISAQLHLLNRKSFNALKNYYQCMLIGYMINQFLEKSQWWEDLKTDHKKLTIKHLWQQLLTQLRILPLCRPILIQINESRHQIRLRSG